MLSVGDRSHSVNKTNNLDPDDGNSWLCSVCKLQIFATPFIRGGGGALVHDQCANLPEELKDCELHPEKTLLLGDHNNNQQTCSECSQICGSKLYSCPDSDCGLVLDVACALPVKILHRSHEHRLVGVRSGARSSHATCGVCNSAHDHDKAAAAAVELRSYFCYICGFWIHPECAALASVIKHEKHAHPLVLYYDIQATFGADEPTPFDSMFSFHFSKSSPPHYNERGICAICGNGVARRCGIYSCIKCTDYVIHVNCATSDPHTFKPVAMGKAIFPNLVRLPFQDKHDSFVRYVAQGRHFSDCIGMHPLHECKIFDHVDYQDITIFDDDDDQDSCRARRLLVCDACIKTIDTPPFYRCSIGINIHDHCHRLPPSLSGSSTHIRGHEIDMPEYFTRGNGESICGHCGCRCFPFGSYHCKESGCSFTLDASCAVMPAMITHGIHNATHFMRLVDEANSSSRGRGCDCCARPLGKLAYECRTCPNFALHTWCASLPRTVTHIFDPHPLTLTTAAAAADIEMMICEICEQGIKSGVWNYSCTKCEQWFHIDCIPCLELTYKIKSLADSGVDIRVPTRLIRGLTLEGHGHDYCADVADEYDILPSY